MIQTKASKAHKAPIVMSCLTASSLYRGMQLQKIWNLTLTLFQIISMKYAMRSLQVKWGVESKETIHQPQLQ